MTERKNTPMSNNKSQISQIHSSLLDLYTYLKMDKIQIVSNISNNINFILIFLFYSYAKINLYQRLWKKFQTTF